MKVPMLAKVTSKEEKATLSVAQAHTGKIRGGSCTRVLPRQVHCQDCRRAGVCRRTMQSPPNACLSTIKVGQHADGGGMPLMRLSHQHAVQKAPDYHAHAKSATCVSRNISGSFDMQLRGAQGIAQRLLARAGVSPKRAPLQNTSPADALLLVSGSHALRPLLSWTGALQVREGIDL
jgi:hypothetical protein